MFEQISSAWRSSSPEAEDETQVLLYRSNLLGSNKSITNFGGGNTSAKLPAIDPLSGEQTTALWVKGSGGDLGSMNKDGFATLYLDKVVGLADIYKNLMDQPGAAEDSCDDTISQLIGHCIFNQNPRAPSIDTTLHALLPFVHIDHMHPDAIISIATADKGQQLCQQIFGGRIGWLPWQRPGMTLALQLKKLVEEQPEIEGIILQHHGLFTWGDSSEDCYSNTISTINQAIVAVNEAIEQKSPFTGTDTDTTKPQQDKALLTRTLRNALSGDHSKLAYFNNSEMTMQFVNSKQCQALSQLGTSCPDHFLRTKIWPLVITAEEVFDEQQLNNRLTQYRKGYQQYYDACKQPDSPAIRDANPVIVLVPGIGMFGFASNRTTARIATEFFENAINVMAGAEAFGRYTSLPEQQAFNIEYWLLEEAKLKRMPAPLPLNGKAALVTGAAGGIGRATCKNLLAAGAAVICCDNNGERLKKLNEDLCSDYSPDLIAAIEMDVTDEGNVVNAFQQAAESFGGVDILVANAGIASAATITETSLATWNLNQNVLNTGYFLVAREAFRLMEKSTGGSIIFIGSKNALASSKGAAAYSTAKAASLHLARCLALEGAEHHIRVNTVNPDAVIEGSAIWSGEWREQRAAGYGIEVDQLENFYKNRSLLKVNVRPEDIAQGVMFFALDKSSRSTGNVLNIDGGNATAFTR